MNNKIARRAYENSLNQPAVDESQFFNTAELANRRSSKRKQTNDDNNIGKRYNTTKMMKTSQVADRHNINNVAVSEIVSAVLADYGIVNDTDSSQVIDRKKVSRAREKNRSQQSEEHIQFDIELKTLYFDSRLDTTKTRLNGRMITAKEDHYSLIEEPGSFFLGFFSMKSEIEQQINDKTKAELVRDKMVEFLGKNNISSDCLKAVGCDGTNMNTGIRGRRYSIFGTTSTNSSTMDHLFDSL